MLSRRDEFAKAAMQGMMAHGWCDGNDDYTIGSAVAAADALIAKLDEGRDDDEYSKLRIDHDKMFDEVVRLRAELARYTSDLTDEQARDVYQRWVPNPAGPEETTHSWDAAIRRVRGGW